MSRINVSNLQSLSELSHGEMGDTVGGRRFRPHRRLRFCFPVLKFVTVRRFGLAIRVPKFVLVCR